MHEEDLLGVLALQKVKGVGDIVAKKLLAHFGSPQAIFKEKKHHLLKVHGVSGTIVNALLTKDIHTAAEKELKYIQNNNIQTYYFENENYPLRLKHCIDAPILLFSTGNIDFSSKRMISIVGTRKITSYGTGFCNELLENLAPYKPTIISGFAYGVDICAHKAAIKHQLPTIAVVAHGFEDVYPKTHKKYMHQIEANGGFLTDFWHDDAILPGNFIKRNRIIAGISEATIIIESAKKGGSLITADIANSYSRDVFAVPGRSTDTQSKGCNDLIRRNQAAILTSAEDLILTLNWQQATKKKTLQKQLFVELSQEEQLIHDYLQSNGKQTLDVISLHAKLAISKVATLLFQLEMKGCVKPLPGKLYECL